MDRHRLLSLSTSFAAVLMACCAFGKPRVIDFGPEGTAGYATLTFTNVVPPARVRVSYATHPDGLGPKGDFWHETRAHYMGWDLWLPILPASTDRYDVFVLTQDGTWRAPLLQGLVRYVRVEVESGVRQPLPAWLVADARREPHARRLRPGVSVPRVARSP